MMLSRKRQITLLLFVAIYYAIGYIHEGAHAAVCIFSGLKADYGFIPYTGEARTVICSGYPENLMLLYASGGLAGTAAASILAFSTRKKFLFVSAFPFVPSQALTMIMETFAHRWYNQADNLIPTFAASAIILCLFSALFILNRQ